MKVYLASSWRNEIQPPLVLFLRSRGFEVYDFRNPAPGNTGFAWSDIDPKWQAWTTAEYKGALLHPIAEAGYKLDYDALDGADAVVIVLPCGRSAHTEGAWAKGRGKPCYVFSPDPCEPELMYKLFDGIAEDVHELESLLRSGK